MTTRRKILIAVDGSPHSLHAVNYVAALCSQSPVEVSLLHILPMASEELIWEINVDEHLKARIKEKYERFNEECDRVSREFLAKAKEILTSLGYVPEYAVTLLQQWQSEIGRGILAEARKGYDAIVVGRRGIGKVESLLMGSICTMVVQGISDIPVWVVGGEIPSQKMLIAVDSSENAGKAVASAAWYAANTGSEVTLFHAVRKFFPGIGHRLSSVGEEVEAVLNEDLKDKIQGMFEKYRRCLEASGVKPEKITTKCNFRSYSRAADILSTAREGGYGTVVMGRRGISAVREFILGRVTSKVLNGAEDLAIWIVP